MDFITDAYVGYSKDFVCRYWSILYVLHDRVLNIKTLSPVLDLQLCVFHFHMISNFTTTFDKHY